jgi:ribulose bisphosphate carboxylase small subunit
MKLRQGQFSFLPVLSDDDIRVQAQYAIGNGGAVSVEYTKAPILGTPIGKCRAIRCSTTRTPPP